MLGGDRLFTVEEDAGGRTKVGYPCAPEGLLEGSGVLEVDGDQLDEPRGFVDEDQEYRMIVPEDEVPTDARVEAQGTLEANVGARALLREGVALGAQADGVFEQRERAERHTRTA